MARPTDEFGLRPPPPRPGAVPLAPGRPKAPGQLPGGSATKTPPPPPPRTVVPGGGGGGGGSEAKYRKSASDRYREQAANLQVQIKALQRALRKDFRHGLDIRLGNVTRVAGQQDKVLMDGYRTRYGMLSGAAEDNTKAADAQTVANTGNQLRERANAVTEAMAQGAGESDALAAQMMSLRNWNANQNDITRSFYDTLRSINSSLGDLNVDTKSARVNNAVQANADREQLWTNYYGQRSEAYTQLGNTLGQQADYYSMAKEMGGKGDGGKAKKAAGAAFTNASKAAGQAWRNPGVSDKLMNWTGKSDFAGNANLSRLESAPVARLDKRPEGATLRKW